MTFRQTLSIITTKVIGRLFDTSKHKVVIKILQGSVATQIELYGLTVSPVTNFL